MKTLNRRDFLRTSGAAALMAATPGTLLRASGRRPRAVHGLSSTGLRIPVRRQRLLQHARAEYSRPSTRSMLQRARISRCCRPICCRSRRLSSPGPDFGLHPAMGRIQTLFEAGNAAFVTNVGPLIEPTTRDQYFNGSVTLPPQLFSHNDQQDQWTSLRGNVPSKTGWAGRMADLIRDGVAGQQMATNASLAGSNLFQSADETVAYVMGPNGPIRVHGVLDNARRHSQRATSCVPACRGRSVRFGLRTRLRRGAAPRNRCGGNPVSAAIDAGPPTQHRVPAVATRYAVTHGCTPDRGAGSAADAAPGIFRGDGWLRFARRPEREPTRAAWRNQ